jgi:hypothetical protein
MKHTLGTAATATGKSKATIHRAVKSGKLSALRCDDGSYEIDPAELHRVFPSVSSGSSAEQQMRQSATPDGTALLEAKISFLERENAQLERTQADLRDDRDHWRRQATALLTHQPAPVEAQATPPAPTEQHGKGKLWQKLFGKLKP